MSTTKEITPEELKIAAEKDAAKALCSDLIETHLRSAAACMHEGVYKLSLAVIVDRTFVPANVTVKSTYTQSYKDEAEQRAKDPNQGELPLDKPAPKPAKPAKPAKAATPLAIEETSILPDMEAECLALPAPGEAAIYGEETVDAQFTEVVASTEEVAK